jgi:2,3-diketo-5-methylthio-1-phosphopentane phosphatase
VDAADRHGGILVSDFDGTITQHDFFRLVVDVLQPRSMATYWEDYRLGRKTHFEALQAIFAEIRVDEAALLDLASQMNPDPELAPLVSALRAAGWEVVVASAGCAWYIQRVLDERNLSLKVHANPGQFVPGRGLRMDLPRTSPFFSPTHGIDKVAVVRAARQTGRPVAFAGDGFPDVEAAALVVPELRFARSDLARALSESGLAFRPFERWAEVARSLLRWRATSR